MIINSLDTLNSLSCASMENSGITIFLPIKIDTPTCGTDNSGQRISLVSKSMHMNTVIDGNMGLAAVKRLLSNPMVLAKVRAYALFSKASGFTGMPGIGFIKSLLDGNTSGILELMDSDVLIVMDGPEMSFKAVGGHAKVTMQGQFVRNSRDEYRPILFLSTQAVPGASVIINVAGVGLYVQVWNSAISFKRNTFIDICKKFPNAK